MRTLSKKKVNKRAARARRVRRVVIQKSRIMSEAARTYGIDVDEGGEDQCPECGEDGLGKEMSEEGLFTFRKCYICGWVSQPINMEA